MLNFGPGMESRSVVTAWDPPRMFAAQGEGWGGSPPIADEWSVEARGGGICVVRVVHSLFASTDDWDNQLEGTESGWPGFFRILRIYLTHFRGQRSAMMQWMAPAAGTEAEAWETLTAAWRRRPWRRQLRRRDHGHAKLLLLRRSGGRDRRPRDTALASVDSRTLPDAVGDEQE